MVLSKCVLIIDGNNIAWRAAAVVGDQKLLNVGGDKLPTTMIDSMLNKRIREMKEEDWYDEVVPVVTFDVSHLNLDPAEPDDAEINRYRYYSEYKANRKIDDDTDSNVVDCMNEKTVWRESWRRRLIDRGITVIDHPGVEADDIMAYAAKTIAGKTDGTVDAAIWTNDKDLMQCVDDKAGIFMYRKRKGIDGKAVETRVDEHEVLKEKGVPAGKIRAQLALLGDAADNYHGIMQYGGKRGIKVVNASDGSYASLLDELLKDEEARLAKKIKSGEVLWDRFSMDVTDQLERNWTLAGCGEEYMPSAAVREADAKLEAVIKSI